MRAFFLSFGLAFCSIFSSSAAEGISSSSAAEGAFHLDLIPSGSLPSQFSDPPCDRGDLRRLIDRKISETGVPGYEAMLSFGFREEGDGWSRLMAADVIKDYFSTEYETAIFASFDHETSVAVRFTEPATITSFLQAALACEALADEPCRAVVFHDRGDSYCLMYTEEQLSN